LYGDTHIKIFVNGQEVGEQFARQNLSAPVKPLLVRIYDIKPLLKPGENVIAVEARNYGTEHSGLEPGGPPRCAGFHFYAEITDADGKLQTVLSDDQWKVTDREQSGWNAVGFDDSGWLKAKPDTKPTVWVTYPDFAKGIAGFWDRR
jgi:hexosaminidase